MQINFAANWKIGGFFLFVRPRLEVPGEKCMGKTYDSNKQVNNLTLFLYYCMWFP